MMTGLDYLIAMRCLVCGRNHAPAPTGYVCGDGGNLDARYDYQRLGAAWDRDALAANGDPSMWRYAPLLPVASPPSFAGGSPLGPKPSTLATVGGTPLIAAPRVADEVGVRQVWVKDEGRNPTGSLKDRASAVAVLKAQEAGAQVITTASSGNAAAALAGMSAAVGLRAVIFVPATAPAAKVAQLLVFGADVYLVEGTYDQAFDLCLAASREYGWYCRNTGYNPYTVEGKKSVSLEIGEQLGWQAPDSVLVSVGDGNIISGVWKGFYDLRQLGWIERMPRIYGIQAAGSDVLCTAWEAGTETITPIVAQTVADSIAVGHPRDAVRALRAVRTTGGEYVRVSDEEILAAIPALARGAAVFAEPSGATGYAGLRALAAAGKLDPDDRVVVIATGSGLKDVASAMRSVGQATRIEPSLDGLARALRSSGGPPA